jgi:hypothetical protein
MIQSVGGIVVLLGSYWKTAIAAAVVTVLFWPWLRQLMPRLLPLVLTLAVIVQWAIALLAAADRQPGGYMLRDITVSSAAREFELGRVALMQNAGLAGSADERHIRFQRDQGDWQISNISTQRRLRLEYAADSGLPVSFDSARLPIVSGDVLQFTESGGGSDRIHFEDVGADGGSLRLRVESSDPALPARSYSFRWSATGLQARDSQAIDLPACGSEDQTGVATLGALRRWRASLGESRDAVVLQFGGGLSCVSGNAATIALQNSPFAAASLHYVRGLGFALTRGRDPAARLLRGSQEIWLANVVHGLHAQIGGREMALRSFVAGYTKYAIDPPDPGERNIAFRILPVDKSHRVMDGSKICNVDAVVLGVGEFGIRVAPRCRVAPNTGDEWRKTIADGTSAARNAAALARWSARTLVAAASGAGNAAWPMIVAKPIVTALLAAAATGVLLYLAIRRRRRRPGAPMLEANGIAGAMVRIGFSVLAGIILLTYVAWKASPAVASAIPMPPWPALAAWALAALAVATARGGGLLDGLILTVLTALVAIGHTAQVELTLASGELRNLRFADDTTAAVTATAALIMLASQIGPNWLAERMRALSVPAQRSAPRNASGWARRMAFPAASSAVSNALPSGMWWALLAILGALVLWFALGTEAGIAGVLQPSEIVKTLTVFILAATVTLALEPDRGPESRQARLAPIRSSGRIWTALASVGRTLWAARLYLIVAIAATVLRLTLVSSGAFAIALELAAVAATLSVAAIWLRNLRNYFWRAFLMIVALLAAILFVPVVRNDLSPFVVLGATSVVTFLIVVIIHWAAIASERLQLTRPQRAPPPDTSRPRPPAGVALTRLGKGLFIRCGRAAGRFLSRPEPWMVVICIGVAVTVWSVGSAALDDARATRRSLMAWVGGSFDKPVERVISWIEFNGKASTGEPVSVEFADVGLQVARSRDVIAASGCTALDRSGTRPDGKHPLPRMLDLAASLPRSVTQPLATAAEARIDSNFLAGACTPDGAGASVATAIAARMPEIQNDFVSTWLVATFGRDGAVGVVMLQCLLLATMVFAGFLTIRWTPGHLLDRPAASVAGYATIGFAVMLGIQWTISWLNALGALPVMGQPSTFMSHGPSHGLLFGAPAVLTAICALRLRSAFLIPKTTEQLDVKWRYMQLRRS